jgi:hypothetical protein
MGSIIRHVTNSRRDENLLVVFAVEEYARKYGISAHETLEKFLKFGVTESIRRCYETLHTQDLYECVSFAEDIIERKNA